MIDGGGCTTYGGIANPLARPGLTIASEVSVSSLSSGAARKFYVGNALKVALDAGDVDLQSLGSPYQNGRIRDWDAAEALWKFVLMSEANTKDVPVLLSQSVHSTRRDRERTAQVRKR